MRRRGARGPDLSDSLEATAVHERRQAARALLRTPLLRPDHPAFGVVRRHAAVLQEWFEAETGWVLDVGRWGARLRKVPPDDDDATRPAVAGSSATPFSRRRYVVLCLLLAVLERGEGQTTLGRLAEAVADAVVQQAPLTEAGVALDLTRREDRADVVAVCRLLLELGVLHRVEGDEATWTGADATRDVLYDVDRAVLAQVLVTRAGASTVRADDLDGRLAGLRGGAVPLGPEARRLELRRRLTRRLLDDPVVVHADLDDDERDYLTNQRVLLSGRVADLTGLVPEARAEGIAMVDPAGDVLTDVKVPDEGTDGHCALLLAERLARATTGVGLDVLERDVARWAARHAGHWRKGSGEPDAVRALALEAVGRLAALRLVRVEPCGGDDGVPRVHPLPVLARYAVAEPVVLGGEAADAQGELG